MTSAIGLTRTPKPRRWAGCRPRSRRTCAPGRCCSRCCRLGTADHPGKASTSFAGAVLMPGCRHQQLPEQEGRAELTVYISSRLAVEPLPMTWPRS